MYNPFQIPYILGREFKENLHYKETFDPECAALVICFWEMEPAKTPNQTVDNIIIPDGCIDLVVDPASGLIGYSGMSQTDFHFPLPAGSQAFGARLRPGAFHQLTRLPATEAMDAMVPLEQVDPNFSATEFAQLSYAEQKQWFWQYLRTRSAEVTQAPEYSPAYLDLFETLYQRPPETVAQLYQQLNYSAKQCQRLFLKHYGIQPKLVLNVIRFQHCLHILTAENVKQSDVVGMFGYYDQPHLIRDIKKHIGITPLELMRAVRKDEFIQALAPQ